MKTIEQQVREYELTPVQEAMSIGFGISRERINEVVLQILTERNRK